MFNNAKSTASLVLCFNSLLLYYKVRLENFIIKIYKIDLKIKWNLLIDVMSQLRGELLVTKLELG